VVRIHFGVLRLFFLTLLFLGQSQLFAAALELRGALRLFGRLALTGQTLDGDPRIQALRIGTRLGCVLIALHQNAVETHPILHEIGDGHRWNRARTTGRGGQNGGTQAPDSDD
jgi:hypothetical protein